MVKIIAITNQKGGVGKTTTSINLTAALAATKKKALLVDLDPQGNATMGSGINKTELSHTVNELLLQQSDWKDTVIKSPAGYDLLPSNGNLTIAEVTLLQENDREYRLKQLLEQHQDRYDFIIIDCPPTLNMLTVNALAAAHSVLIPIQCEYYALEGLSALLDTVAEAQGSINTELAIEGLLRTMYDGRNRLAIDVSEQLISHFNDKVFRTVIPRNVRLAEAPSHGQSIIQYDKKSQGALAYLTLAGEVIRRVGKAK